MGAIQNYPYADVHQLNLDWIIKTIKEVRDKEDELDQAVSDAQGYAENAENSALSAEESARTIAELFVTPEMFGAVGDGVTDDTDAFVQLNGKYVFMPAKTYIVRNVTFNSETVLIGSGIGKTILKLKDNSPINNVITVDHGTDCHFEGFTIDGNKENNALYNTNDSGLKIISSVISPQIYHDRATYNDIEIKNCANIGLGLIKSGTDTWIWVLHMNNLFIHECRIGMVDNSSDNEFSNFHITNNIDADLLCKDNGSNKYVNFKLDGESGRTQSSDLTESGASLILSSSANLSFINLDVQSAKYQGVKAIYSHNIFMQALINNCGTAYDEDSFADMAGIGITLHGCRDSFFDLNFNVSTKPLQRTNVVIDATSSRVSVNYVADVLTHSSYPSTYTNSGTDCNIIRKDQFMPISYVQLTLSSTDGWSSTVPYPYGFARSNCMPVLAILSDTWRNGFGISGNANTRTFASCETDGVRVYNNDSAFRGLEVRVFLIRCEY